MAIQTERLDPPNIVYEAEVPVSIPAGPGLEGGQHQVLLHQGVAAGRHAGQPGADSTTDLGLEVSFPAELAVAVAAGGQTDEVGGGQAGGADETELLGPGLQDSRAAALHLPRGGPGGPGQDVGHVPLVGVQQLLGSTVTHLHQNISVYIFPDRGVVIEDRTGLTW